MSYNTETDDNAIQGTVARADLEGPDDSLGAIFPTKPYGIEFLKENNAWGFVHINRDPDFVGMYVSKPRKEVCYFARVASIVDADSAELAQPPESYTQYASRKQVIEFESNSLYELKDPISYHERIPYSLRYTDLGKFQSAAGTDDLF